MNDKPGSWRDELLEKQLNRLASDKGLYSKYTVIDNETGEEVTDFCFVLLPLTDGDAYRTMWYYTWVIGEDNPKLAKDINTELKKSHFYLER